MTRLLSIALLAATLSAQERLTSEQIAVCVVASVKPSGVGKVQVRVENKCGVRLGIVAVSLKYFDRTGYRIGSDAPLTLSSVYAPYVASGERLKQVVPLIPGSVRAEVRDIWGMQ